MCSEETMNINQVAERKTKKEKHLASPIIVLAHPDPEEEGNLK